MQRRATLACLAAGFAGAVQLVAPGPGQEARQRLLLQTTDSGATGGKERDTPITRVVALLKNMGKTLEKEQTEDEELYQKLACWCNSNDYEKGNAIEASTAKISELEASIDSGAAKKSELTENIKELTAEAASDRQSLSEATALRDKQLQEFHGEEKDAIQAIEQLKAAIVVLGKHHSAPPDSTVAGGAIFKSERDSWSLLSTRARGFPWAEDHKEEEMTRSLDDFMRKNGFSANEEVAPAPRKVEKFLQAKGAAVESNTAWSPDDAAVVRRAVAAASSFMQAHHGASYMPSYSAQSGEIMGVLQQLKEEMEADLSDSQKREMARAGAFEEMRTAKTAEIENGEKMEEQKEAELATTSNELAEAREDHGQEKLVLGEDQRFLANLKETCGEASKNFEERKSARMTEMKAVSETIEILMADDARDAMAGTYNFVQTGSVKRSDRDRREVAASLRAVALKTKSPQLSILATTVELDAFSKVKKAIDDMVAMLKQQMQDEVKKADWCKSELHENELTTAKTTDHKADLEATIAEHASSIKTLEDETAAAKKAIAQMQLDLQRATENRKAENLDFQKVVADQTTTVEVLKKALDKLATYYDFLQTKAKAISGQTPPVPQAEYNPSKSSAGVMEMIEKLIHEAQDLTADSKNSEQNAQAAYESTIADTNASVEQLSKEIVAKTKAKARTEKDKFSAESDHSDRVAELEGLAKYNGDIHQECDYLTKNFEVRQTARKEEVEALQQAKQVLSGAALS